MCRIHEHADIPVWGTAEFLFLCFALAFLSFPFLSFHGTVAQDGILSLSFRFLISVCVEGLAPA